MIHVRIPSILRLSGAAAEFSLTDSPTTVGELIKIEVFEPRYPLPIQCRIPSVSQGT